VAKYVSSPNTAAVLCKSIWVADLEMRALRTDLSLTGVCRGKAAYGLAAVKKQKGI